MIILIKNQKGALTLDFIFALLLIFSITLILGIFSFTLSISESIQYLAFSSSRAYFAGHKNQQKQIELGEKKFSELKATGAYKKFLQKDWFDTKLLGIGDFASEYSKSDTKDIFEGARLQVDIGILNFNIPLFGSTENDSGKYTTFITSFIGREVSSDECMNVIANRFNGLLDLAPYNTGTIDAGRYISFDDNGC